MARVAIVLSLLIALLVGTAALLQWVPALNFQLFTLALGGTEWSPWLIIASLVGIGVGWLGWRGGTWRGLAGLSLIINLLALLVLSQRLWASISTPPLVRSTMPDVTSAGPGTFSLAAFFASEPSAGVTIQPNVRYATVDGVELLLDVYHPTPAPSSAPAIMVVHGGSWRGGEKSEIAETNLHWVNQGYVVFDVAYRLSPQQRFPAAVSDVKCALGYVTSNAASYGIDPERIALVGRSAGAQLALLAAYTPDAPELAPSCAASAVSVRSVIGFYSPTRLAYYDRIKPSLTDGALDDYLGGPPEEFPQRYEQARPKTWVDAATPPTLLLHGDRDQFVRPLDTRELADALAAAAVPFVAIELPYANHGFDFNPHGPSNQLVQPYVDRFLAQTLR